MKFCVECDFLHPFDCIKSILIENDIRFPSCIPFEPRHEKNLFLPYANNKGADQPAHPRSLISAFVVRC